ncbi:MAG TPA: hypothetical protein VJT50_01985 [Pyrinomonadaceae bacterium]|nr:hypothetical protein [Pyrinomonadaceae bacterium]
MLRTVTLSLLMLISVGVMLPFASSTAHGIRQSYVSNHHRRYRRHSRAWWRRHRARQRMRQSVTMAHRNSPLASDFSLPANPTVPVTVMPNLPAGWDKPVLANNGEIKFKTVNPSAAPSQASLSVVARSRPNPAYLTKREEKTMLAGVSFSDLRRTVIEKMINAGGWVVNDYERNVSGARVFVVVAQTPGDAGSPEKAWNFYFAEIDGKIYSLSLNTPLANANQLAAEGETFLSTLRAKANGQTANK